jgi:mRNA-degrading endonuclease RelE of RelBE toxin-antitoxin system
MVYKFVFRASALKEFEGLTQGQRKAISEKLKALEADPFAEGKTLEKYAPLRRVKAGDVRVIFDPEADAKGRLIIWRLAGPRGAIAYRQTALTTTIDLQSRISIAASVAIRE